MSETPTTDLTATSPAWVESTALVVTVVTLAALGVFAVAAGVTLASGEPPLHALGIGAFCTLGGGPGFAAIVFGARYATSLDARRPALSDTPPSTGAGS
jgi:hypothetical protein